MELYKIFLIIIILCKTIYIFSTLNLHYNLEYYDKHSDIIKTKRIQNRILYIISDTMMSCLLLYLFVPTSYKNVTIGNPEKIALFTLGIMNLLQFEWLQPMRYYNLM